MRELEEWGRNWLSLFELGEVITDVTDKSLSPKICETQSKQAVRLHRKYVKLNFKEVVHLQNCPLYVTQHSAR